MSKISNEVIENFLQGSDPQEYIVAIEAGYSEPTVTLVINDPVTGKRLEPHPFKPFLWFKHDITSILYGGNKVKRIEAGRSYGVKISELRTSNSEGFSPERLERGYKYMATCNKSYNDSSTSGGSNKTKMTHRCGRTWDGERDEKYGVYGDYCCERCYVDFYPN